MEKTDLYAFSANPYMRSFRIMCCFSRISKIKNGQPTTPNAIGLCGVATSAPDCYGFWSLGGGGVDKQPNTTRFLVALINFTQIIDDPNNSYRSGVKA
jgi:hypothetical protein